jgi:peroxiredoxin Q/BCP
MVAKRVGIGDEAPDFTLRTESGEPIRLGEFRGKKAVVLFFYPKDNSPGCTKEACAFRDNFTAFKEAGAEVLGVSSDSEESHSIFSLSLGLPYRLLSDPGGKVRELYGVQSSLGLIPGRVTFVIDKTGVVRLVFSSQLNAEKHADEALRILRDL